MQQKLQPEPEASSESSVQGIDATLAQRQNVHGDFAFNAQISRELKQVIWNHGSHTLAPVQAEALEVIMAKVARILSGDPNFPDHWHDIQGYAKLVENSLAA